MSPAAPSTAFGPRRPDKLARLGLGLRHYDGNTTLCMASAVAGYKLSFGTGLAVLALGEVFGRYLFYVTVVPFGTAGSFFERP